MGLSPRVRGNLQRVSEAARATGSIPACAGEPSVPRWAYTASAVYPRVCGGTIPAGQIELKGTGLSPRVRGNPVGLGALGDVGGSIPACAGEPPHPYRAPSSPRVYPRVCGGTTIRYLRAGLGGGLSPRVRGNPLAQRLVGGGPGSIPACAGEPWARPPDHPHPAVYPRVCGGTSCERTVISGSTGLSPRVRGNRNGQNASGGLPGSIPACAGEPTALGAAAFTVMGLSPRVRGNRLLAGLGDQADRSIPACAGEPK